MTADELQRWREQLKRDATVLALDLARGQQANDTTQLRVLSAHLRTYHEDQSVLRCGREDAHTTSARRRIVVTPADSLDEPG